MCFYKVMIDLYSYMSKGLVIDLFPKGGNNVNLPFCTQLIVSHLPGLKHLWLLFIITLASPFMSCFLIPT